MRLVLGIVLLWSAAAAAETVNTDCYRYGNSVSCQTVTTPQRQESPRQEPLPNLMDSFLKGREARLRHDQMQLQNELLQQQIDASKRAEFEREEARRTESALRAQARWEQIRQESEASGDAEALLDYWRQQVSACARIAKRFPERREADCVDNLLVTDPEFARAHAAARRNRVELSEVLTESVTGVQKGSEVVAPVESSATCTPARIRLGSCRVAREP